MQLVTCDPDAARCPGCREVSTSVKGWVLTRPKDVPCGGMAVVMQWRKRRWRCRMQDCPQQTFTEAVGQVAAGMRTTTRLREGLARAVADGRDQSEVAAAHGVSWPTVARALVDYASGARRARTHDGAGQGRDRGSAGHGGCPRAAAPRPRSGGGAPIRGRPGSLIWARTD
ncbi:MAG: transposase family protein [Pseudonocardiaceae bacterium]